MTINLNGALDKDAGPELNTTPLIDVMLVLLVMLLVSLPVATHAVKIGLGSGTAAMTPPIHTVNVEFDGALSWDGQAVDRAALDARLSQSAFQHPQPEIRVVADRLARYDAVAKVMADAQRLGIRDVAIEGTQDYAQK